MIGYWHRGNVEMIDRFQESLDNLCKNCQSLMSQISVPIREDEISNANCGHQLCPFRHIDNSYCEDYMTLQELINNYSIMEEQVKTCEHSADKKIEQLEKALDIACEFIEDGNVLYESKRPIKEIFLEESENNEL